MTATITAHDLTVGDVTFHLNEAGPVDGAPIVFLHGSGPGATGMSNWETVMGQLADTYRCIAPDIVGFGDSTHPNPPPQGMAAFTQLRVDTLLDLFDVLGLDRVTLVGNSMGGIISVTLTQQAPERVSSLVLMGTGGGPVGQPSEGLVKLITFYDDPTAANMSALLTHFVHDPSHFGDRLGEIVAARLPRALRPEVERSHRATFSQEGGPLAIDESSVAAIAQPTLVLHGDDDRIMPLRVGEWYAKHVPDAHLEVFADTGHWLQIEQPDRFVSAVRGFLGGLDR